MMVQIERKEFVDLHPAFDRGVFRPRNAEGGAQGVRGCLRPRQKRFVSQVGAPERARGSLGVENVPQPDEIPDRRVDPVSFFQGKSHIRGIADRRNDEGSGTESPHGFNPEGQQAAYARVLQNEQPAVDELVLKYRAGPLAELLRDRRGVPSPVERAPVVPCGAGRRQDLVIQGHEISGLPMSERIGRALPDQSRG